ncbi:urea transporter [Trinickia acidisoli]|uniref:urea transporter n=1 Tax=Trinickia acidisoli TaxID=2767482 RepID=UPI002852E4F8|nr:urea transporter [Trinickia acidisoli]
MLRTLLRCMGQTVLQCNALTGACVLAALALCDLRLACAAIIGALAAHVCAVIGHYDPIAMRDGLHGFNGVLCALAAVTFVNDTRIALAVALLSAIAATCLAAPWSRLLSTRGLAVYSSPCLVVTWCWLLLRAGARMPADHASASNASASLGPLYTQALRIRFPLDAAFGVGHLVRPPSPIGNVLASAAQTVFASGAWPGLLIVVGIALASRRAALHTLAGAAVSSAVAWTCGAPLGALHTGMAGFNGALAALALCDRGPVATLAAAMLSALLYQAVAHMGWPAMSAPFVVAAWCVHACMRAFDRQRPFAH